MTHNFMITNPRNKFWKKRLWQMIDELDIHKWIVGFEEGKDGYRHLQVRVRLSKGKEEGFTAIKKYLPIAHVEECSDTWEYERKTARFLSSDDTPEIRKVRFGKPHWYQAEMIKNTLQQGDRGITVWYNPSGKIGKSWLCNWLWETGQAYIVQVTDNVKSMVQDVASEYMEHGFRKILVLDFPREWKWNSDVYTAIERIKDGLIKDTRYHSRTINIRGVCLLVLCNTAPDTKRLSDDRWDIHEDYYV